MTELNYLDITKASDGHIRVPSIGLTSPAITESIAKTALASFADGAEGIPVKSLLADINPVQTGSGDPSPTNIRPITGWTGMNVVRTGKNRFSVDALTGKNIYRANIQKMGDNVNSFYLGGAQGNNDNMQLIVNSWAYCALLTGIKVTADTPAVISCKIKNYTADCNGYVRLRVNTTNTRAGATTIGETYFNATGTTDISVSGTVQSGNYIILEFSPASKSTNVTLTQYAEVTECQLEIGTSTATAFEPYKGTTYPISWADEAGTVYGGTLDVTTGLLTVTHQIVDLASMTFSGGWQLASDWVQLATTGLTNVGAMTYLNAIGSMRLCTSSGNAWSFWRLANNQIGLTFAKADLIANGYDGSTAASAISAASAYEAGLATHDTIMYPLATPVTYQLTPQAVLTILGQNNIWADTGDVEVAYCADTKLYIDKVLTE